MAICATTCIACLLKIRPPGKFALAWITHAVELIQDQENRIDANHKEIRKLRREIEYLRHYGNKDCTAMAEAAMADGALDRG